MTFAKSLTQEVFVAFKRKRFFSGDFYQLPPVGTQDDPDTIAFCFESADWATTFKHCISLKTIFRQKIVM